MEMECVGCTAGPLKGGQLGNRRNRTRADVLRHLRAERMQYRADYVR
jgi:hypothetical protein